MGELLYPDILLGKNLEEIIMHPTLWAKRIELAAQEGLDALSDLQIQLSKIEGPVARARECQVFLALNNPEEAAKVIEGQTHNLCKAMHLAVKIYYRTLENYLYIIDQPEVLTRDISELGLESQMRWDFMRAQSYQQTNHFDSALRFYSLAHRVAYSFDVNSILQVSEIQMRVLAPSPIKHRIEALLVQWDQIKKNQDFRVNDYILENLCTLYFLDNDLDSLLKYALKLHPDILLDHTILVTDFFLGLPASAQLHKLNDYKNQPFCASGYLLSVVRDFKRHIGLLRNNQDTAAKLKTVLETNIPENLDVPILNLIMLSVKVIAYMAAENFTKAEKSWNQMKYIEQLFEMTEDLPYWAKYYVNLTRAFLSFKKGYKVDSDLRESIVEGLGKMASFSNFVAQLCPELVYMLNEQEQSEILEKVLSEVLIITEEGCFLENEKMNGFPEHSALVEEIDRWYRGVEKKDPELMEIYAKRVLGMECKGVVIAWKVEEKMRELK
ncbi:MAG: hypothetical protein U0Z75_09190 [Deinococcaceae bacterium]